MKRIVISGPTGAIGMALIAKCIEEKTQVLAICHRGSARIKNIPVSPYVTVLEADLSEYRSLFCNNQKAEKYDAFYHFAWNGTVGDARNDMHLQTDNIAYTMDAVELAERLGCHTFVGAGSQAEYGRSEGRLTAELPTKPENGYGMAKLCAGQMSRIVCEKKQIKHIWTRILSVYGPYDGAGSMVMSAIRKFWNGESPAFTPGGQLWDYLYSRDAANIFYALGEKGVHGAVYCVGSGQARELKSYIRDIYSVIKEYQGEKIEADGEELDRILGIGLVPYGEKQVMHLCADTALLEQHIGKVKHTDFKQGIRSILETNKEILGLL
ncbi:MAG: NAD-dependent epimerase/dehydratase family protein [Lachnospiraceae bacterium]|nr:NAD-dependent epimerase/dehydratase family protein [Lachnospiraceae bacterium]